MANCALRPVYRFDPSHDEDGATVKIPLQALPQVDENMWSWGIPRLASGFNGGVTQGAA